MADEEDKADFDAYFAQRYNTRLSTKDEKKFKEWVDQASVANGRDVSMDVNDYDLRGFWLHGGSKQKKFDHLPDTFKKPNHPTFSDQSIYNGTPSPYGGKYVGGKWVEGVTGEQFFKPSKEMLGTTHPLDWLKQYMQEREPGVGLLVPKD